MIKYATSRRQEIKGIKGNYREWKYQSATNYNASETIMLT